MDWLRPLALGLPALALISACAGKVQPEPAPETDPGTAALAPAEARAQAPKAGPDYETFVTRAPSFAAPVSVVALVASEASACERMCGRLGTCLGDRADHEASYLELSCLDLCVNVREEAPVAALFQGCEQRESCEDLLACASENWDAARLARVEYDSLVDASAVNVCESYCTGIYGCMYFDKTLAEGLEFTESTQSEVNSCVSICDANDPVMIASASCVMEMTCMEYWSCLERNQNAGF